MDAFKADVVVALGNYRVASRASKTEFAASLAEKKAQDLADVALGTLESLIEKHRGALAERAKQREGAPLGAEPAAADGQEKTAENGLDDDRTERTVVDDLSRCAASLCSLSDACTDSADWHDSADDRLWVFISGRDAHMEAHASSACFM